MLTYGDLVPSPGWTRIITKRTPVRGPCHLQDGDAKEAVCGVMLNFEDYTRERPSADMCPKCAAWYRPIKDRMFYGTTPR